MEFQLTSAQSLEGRLLFAVPKSEPPPSLHTASPRATNTA